MLVQADMEQTRLHTEAGWVIGPDVRWGKWTGRASHVSSPDIIVASKA